jgi:hypothetical protein
MFFYFPGHSFLRNNQVDGMVASHHQALCKCCIVASCCTVSSYYSLICPISHAPRIKVLNSIMKYNTNFKTFIYYKLCVTILLSLLHQGCGVGVKSNFGAAGVGKNVPTPTSL